MQKAKWGWSAIQHKTFQENQNMSKRNPAQRMTDVRMIAFPVEINVRFNAYKFRFAQPEFL